MSEGQMDTNVNAVEDGWQKFCRLVNGDAIAKSVLYDLDLLPEQIGEDTKRQLQAFSLMDHIQNARNVGLEEAAKVCDRKVDYVPRQSGMALLMAAAEIRKLKT